MGGLSNGLEPRDDQTTWESLFVGEFPKSRKCTYMIDFLCSLAVEGDSFHMFRRIYPLI
jgi:hypothetical protein